MKLHNRSLKAEYWTDADLLLELDVIGRHFFVGILQLAEDSGCFEYDLRQMKALLYLTDREITTETLQGYCETLIKLGKLIPYAVDGEDYLYVANFHKHQSLRAPQSPKVPLPEWIKYVREDGRRCGKYLISGHSAAESLREENVTQNGRTSEIVQDNAHKDLVRDDCVTQNARTNSNCSEKDVVPFSTSTSLSYSSSIEDKSTSYTPSEETDEPPTGSEAAWDQVTREFRAAFKDDLRFPFAGTRKRLIEHCSEVGKSPMEALGRINQLRTGGVRDVRPWLLFVESQQGAQVDPRQDPNDPMYIPSAAETKAYLDRMERGEY